MLCRFCSAFNCRRLTSSFRPPAMSPAHHRYRFPIPSHPTLASLDCRRALLRVLCVQLFSLAHPLFSSAYELLFSQLPCFQCLLRCPMFFPNPSPKRKITMTLSASKPSFINNSARCVHFYPNGRRCRLSATNLSSRGIIDSIFAKKPFPNRGCPSMMRELLAVPHPRPGPADSAVSPIPGCWRPGRKSRNALKK